MRACSISFRDAQLWLFGWRGIVKDVRQTGRRGSREHSARVFRHLMLSVKTPRAVKDCTGAYNREGDDDRVLGLLHGCGPPRLDFMAGREQEHRGKYLESLAAAELKTRPAPQDCFLPDC